MTSAELPLLEKEFSDHLLAHTHWLIDVNLAIVEFLGSPCMDEDV